MPESVEIRVHLTLPPSRARWKALMALAEVMAENNAYWYGAAQVEQAQYAEQGLPMELPPCCAGCAEPKVKYRPPPPGIEQHCQNFWSGSQMLQRRKATCIDAAAYDAGVARAKGQKASVYLEPQGQPQVPGDPFSTLDFHAVAIIDGKRVDSSEKLKVDGCRCG